MTVEEMYKKCTKAANAAYNEEASDKPWDCSDSAAEAADAAFTKKAKEFYNEWYLDRYVTLEEFKAAAK